MKSLSVERRCSFCGGEKRIWENCCKYCGDKNET